MELIDLALEPFICIFEHTMTYGLLLTINESCTNIKGKMRRAASQLK